MASTEEIEHNQELFSLDLEIIILSLLSFWGDGNLDQDELDFIKDHFKNSKRSTLFNLYSDPNDKDLSAKEYLLWAFDHLHETREQKNAEGLNLEHVEEDLLRELTIRLNKAYNQEKIGQKVNNQSDESPYAFRRSVKQVLKLNKLTKREKVLRKIFNKHFLSRTHFKKFLNISFGLILIILPISKYLDVSEDIRRTMGVILAIILILYVLNFIRNKVRGF